MNHGLIYALPEVFQHLLKVISVEKLHDNCGKKMVPSGILGESSQKI